MKAKTLIQLQAELSSEMDILSKVSNTISVKTKFHDFDDIKNQVQKWIKLVTDFTGNLMRNEHENIIGLKVGIEQLYNLVVVYFSKKGEDAFIRKNHEIYDIYRICIGLIEDRLLSSTRKLHRLNNIHKISFLESIDSDQNISVQTLIRSIEQDSAKYGFWKKREVKNTIKKFFTGLSESIQKKVLFEKDTLIIIKDISHQSKHLIKLLGELRLKGFEELVNKLDELNNFLASFLNEEEYNFSEADGLIKSTAEILDDKQKELLHLSLLRDKELTVLEYKLKNMIFVRLTQFFPYHGVVRTELSAIGGYRDTLHFTVNGPIGFDGFGDEGWRTMPISILIPSSKFPIKRIKNFAGVDIIIFGNLKLTKGSMIIIYKPYLSIIVEPLNVSLAEFFDWFEIRGIILYCTENNVFDETRKVLKQCGRDGSIKWYGQNMILDDDRQIAKSLGDDVTAQTHDQTLHGKPEVLGKNLDYLNQRLRMKKNYEDGLFTGVHSFGYNPSIINDFKIFHESIKWLRFGVTIPYYRKVNVVVLHSLSETLKTFCYVLSTILSRLSSLNNGTIDSASYNIYQKLLEIIPEGFNDMGITKDMYLFSPEAFAVFEQQKNDCISLIYHIREKMSEIKRVSGSLRRSY
ncbi:MAG: hypothetical protein ABIC04_07545 [Nanoarchaeota archaeon]